MFEDKFWVVFSPKLGEAPSEHTNIVKAESCAYKLATEMPAYTFYVAAVVSGFKAGHIERIDMVDPF